MISTPAESEGRIFYRVVKTDPPTLLDFQSNAARGLPPRYPDTDILRLWDGLSVFATEEQARRVARRFPALGTYISAVRLSDAAPVRIEAARGPGHHTLWAEAAELLSRVAFVVPV